jgi:hypothetical protein
LLVFFSPEDFDVIEKSHELSIPPESVEGVDAADVEGWLHVPSSFNRNAPSHCNCRPQGSSAPPPSDTDENLLKVYRERFSPLFPFVVIDQNVTIDELAAKKPFLMSTIRMVTSSASARSVRLQMYQVMRQLTETMLMQSERSLDLIQGILVVIAWYHYHCVLHAQLTNLICLARSLVADLGLNRPPIPVASQDLNMLYPERAAQRTNDEKRALLGVWYLNSW